MNIRIRAALYSIGFFAVIFVFLMALNAIIPYLQPWMGSALIIAILIYAVYQLMLTKLKFDEDLGRLNTKDKE